MDAKRLFQALGSLRLTLVLLGFSLVLVFVGTVAQVKLGIHASQAKYFQSFIVFADVGGKGLRLPVLPGGYLLGSLLVVNLVCSYAGRFSLKNRNMVGLLLIHGGLLMLLLGQLATDMLAVESSMRLKEGQSLNYSEAFRKFELAIIDTSDPKHDVVTAIPARLLKTGGTLRAEALPFEIDVRTYWPNSENVATNTPNNAPEATRGTGLRFKFAERPVTARTDRRNVPTAYLDLRAGDESLGTWLVTGWLDKPESLEHDGRRFELILRPTRYYKPYAIHLEDFSHDRYLGTQIPKNFSSLVRVQRPDTGEDREVLIYMNHPLRYAGETYYQSGYDERDPTITILQVVRNPGWLTPYLGCVVVSLGLLVQFLGHLGKFLRKKVQ
ncbi:MAG: cytochrome c biogenesis protein ResB [Verrucomicrobiales bacterium]|nr:cytochrome c biogenesis protein ResB [Verrucomicrobiales bacterium]